MFITILAASCRGKQPLGRCLPLTRQAWEAHLGDVRYLVRHMLEAWYITCEYDCLGHADDLTETQARQVLQGKAFERQKGNFLEPQRIGRRSKHPNPILILKSLFQEQNACNIEVSRLCNNRKKTHENFFS